MNSGAQAVTFGLDAVRVWHPNGYAVGPMGTIGIGGGKSKYFFGASAAALLVGLAIAAQFPGT